MKTLPLLLLPLAAALCACGDGTSSRRTPPGPAPTDGFQKLIFDSQGFAVLRDRQTGCQWIAVLVANRTAEDMVPRTATGSEGRPDQLCTSAGDPLSKPMKVEGERGLFQEITRSDLGTDIEVRTYRDIETGCEWLVTYTGYDRLKLIMRPRTAPSGGRVEQVCRPIPSRG